MDIKEKLALRKKYKELSDEALLGMLSEGKGSYREGAFALLEEEAKLRGLDARPEEGQKTEDRPGHSSAGPEETEVDTFVEIVIINHKDDIAAVESILGGTGIKYYFQALSLREKDLPVSLMVEQERVEDAVGALTDFKPDSSIILW